MEREYIISDNTPNDDKSNITNATNIVATIVTARGRLTADYSTVIDGRNLIVPSVR